MFLIRSTEMYYSPLDPMFCFYIEKVSSAAELAGWKHFSWETRTLRKTICRVCFSFLFSASIVCFSGGRKNSKASRSEGSEQQKVYIGARHNNRCRNEANIQKYNVWFGGEAETECFCHQHSVGSYFGTVRSAERGQCGFDVVWIWIIKTRSLISQHYLGPNSIFSYSLLSRNLKGLGSLDQQLNCPLLIVISLLNTIARSRFRYHIWRIIMSVMKFVSSLRWAIPHEYVIESKQVTELRCKRNNEVNWQDAHASLMHRRKQVVKFKAFKTVVIGIAILNSVVIS